MASGNFLLFFDSIECAFFFGWRQAMTYANKLYARVVSLAKSPVFKDSFAGNDVRFSHEFEALERELGKAQSLHESVPIDWLAERMRFTAGTSRNVPTASSARDVPARMVATVKPTSDTIPSHSVRKPGKARQNSMSTRLRRS